MNWFEKLIYSSIYKWTWKQPKIYGWFHICYLFVILIVTLVCALIMRNRSDVAVRIFILICASISLMLEAIKQILLSFKCDDDNNVSWVYDWYSFPFQLCSTTMYMSFLSNILWKGRIQRALDAAVVIVMMGATTVLFYPSSVLATIYIFICHQTMIHHGLMIVIGVVLMETRLELNHKTFFLYGLPVYYVLVIIALVMDICFYYFYGDDQHFNMFFISPFYTTSYPVIDPLRIKAYPVFLLIYIVMSTIYGYLIFFAGFVTKHIFNKIRVYLKNRKKSELKEECLYI
jgi:hypothetical protein